MYKSASAEAHCWRWSPSALASSPSAAGGLSAGAERRLRRAGCALILAVASRLFDSERLRAPTTTACLLFQRFFSRRSFLAHDRTMIALAALFVASKVEEAHRRPHALLEAAHAALHGVRRLPYSEGAAAGRAAREALLEAERVLLAALEFDAAVEQPYPLVREMLQTWRRDTASGEHKEKRPELAALERAAGDIILAACVFFARRREGRIGGRAAERRRARATSAGQPRRTLRTRPAPPPPPRLSAARSMSTQLPLLFTMRELATGALFAAYQLAPPSIHERLRVQDAAFFALMDRRLLTAFVERLAAACEELAEEEEAVRAALPYLPLHEGLRRLLAGGGGGGGSARGDADAAAAATVAATATVDVAGGAGAAAAAAGTASSASVRSLLASMAAELHG